MLKNQGFEMLISSDSDYECLVCEIYYDGEYFGLISQESVMGIFSYEPAQSSKVKSVDLIGFRDILEQACEQLKR